ncbi:MAG: T9SS type A sorting domain-containing protein [Bacteroidia bacterium]
MLNATINGGVGPYTFLWNTGDTTQSLAILTAGGESVYILSVTDILGTTVTDSILVMGMPECVWPGDANGDGVADNTDVLILGLTYGAQGMVRPDAHTNFIGQGAPAWTQAFASGLNYVHSDTDGDGVVDANDFFAIGKNYFNPVQSPGGSPVVTEGIPIYVVFPQGNFEPGDIVTGAIMLGTEAQPADSVYGIAFSLAYDGAIVDSGSVIVSYDSSWLGNLHVDLEAIDKDFYLDGQVDVGITRTNHLAVAGYGRIADITIMIDDITGKKEGLEDIGIQIERISLVDKAGVSIPVSNVSSHSVISLANDRQIDKSSIFKVFPNPVHTLMYVETDLPFWEKSTLRMRDIQGKVWHQSEINSATKFKLDISTLPAGMYLVELEHAAGREVQKVILR